MAVPATRSKRLPYLAAVGSMCGQCGDELVTLLCLKMCDYGVWTIVELRNELRKRNARLSGRKKELVERFLSVNAMHALTYIVGYTCKPKPTGPGVAQHTLV